MYFSDEGLCGRSPTIVACLVAINTVTVRCQKQFQHMTYTCQSLLHHASLLRCMRQEASMPCRGASIVTKNQKLDAIQISQQGQTMVITADSSSSSSSSNLGGIWQLKSRQIQRLLKRRSQAVDHGARSRPDVFDTSSTDSSETDNQGENFSDGEGEEKVPSQLLKKLVNAEEDVKSIAKTNTAEQQTQTFQLDSKAVLSFKHRDDEDSNDCPLNGSNSVKETLNDLQTTVNLTEVDDKRGNFNAESLDRLRKTAPTLDDLPPPRQKLWRPEHTLEFTESLRTMTSTASRHHDTVGVQQSTEDSSVQGTSEQSDSSTFSESSEEAHVDAWKSSNEFDQRQRLLMSLKRLQLRRKRENNSSNASLTSTIDDSPSLSDRDESFQH